MNNKLYQYMVDVVENHFVYPSSIEIHPTNLCNQDCVWCIMREQRKSLTSLSYDELASIAAQMAACEQMRYVFISGGGDPLCNSSLFEAYTIAGVTYKTFFEALSKNGIDVGVSTNGELLNLVIEHEAYPFIGTLRVSVDAGTEESYSELHRSKEKKSLRTIVENIQRYYEVSGKQIEISFLEMRRNEKEYLLLADLFTKPEAISKLMVKNLINAEARNMDALSIIQNQIKIEFPKTDTANPYNFMNRMNLLINAEGKLYTCCHVIEKGDKYLLGNINKDSITTIIKKRQDVIEKSCCDRCATLSENRELNKFYDVYKKIKKQIT